MDESELQTAMKMPAGLTNLGNTCYMNATVQCLKSVPEFKEALVKYESGGGNSYDDASGLNHAMTSAMRDLYRSMDQVFFKAFITCNSPHEFQTILNFFFSLPRSTHSCFSTLYTQHFQPLPKGASR